MNFPIINLNIFYWDNIYISNLSLIVWLNPLLKSSRSIHYHMLDVKKFNKGVQRVLVGAYIHNLLCCAIMAPHLGSRETIMLLTNTVIHVYPK